MCIRDRVKAGANYAISLKAQNVAGEEGYSQVLWLDGVEQKYIEEVGAKMCIRDRYSSIHGFPLLPARLRHWETVSFYLLLVVCLVSYTSSCLTCCSAYCSFYYSIKNV